MNVMNMKTMNISLNSSQLGESNDLFSVWIFYNIHEVILNVLIIVYKDTTIYISMNIIEYANVE